LLLDPADDAGLHRRAGSSWFAPPMALFQSGQSMLFKSGLPAGNLRGSGFQAPHDASMTLATA